MNWTLMRHPFWTWKLRRKENQPSKCKNCECLPDTAVMASDAPAIRKKYIEEKALKLANDFDTNFDKKVIHYMATTETKMLIINTYDAEVFNLAKVYIEKQLQLRGFDIITNETDKKDYGEFYLYASWYKPLTIEN